MILTRWMPQRVKRAFTIMSICLVAGVTTGQAAHSPNEVISPNHETYKAIALLVKHGAITDTKGIELGETSYTVRQMTPLINDIVQRREQMNENDKQVALKMYRDYMDEIRDYNVMLDKQEKAEKLAKTLEKQGIEFSELEQPKEKALTAEQIQKKMDAFVIDDSRVKVGGDVRIRYSGQEGKSTKADARARTEVAIRL